MGIGIARIPLPSASDALDGSYVHAVGYFIEPLLTVPILGLALIGDVAQLEHHGARQLVPQRILLIVILTVVPIACMLPSAATRPAPQPVQVMIENVLFITGEACALATALPASWLWAPITAVALIGLMGPDEGLVPILTGVNRTASAADIVAAGVVFLAGGALYLVVRPRPRLERLVERIRAAH
ncbi:hypothetical protein [Microlunatus elymi]|uniref:hypothetical protein n=1 Tax=Microlunatus elymi TaxID=2596828 RepID=UPI00143D7F7D|nr:hypothetical protein [Microlunatus elymi]